MGILSMTNNNCSRHRVARLLRLGVYFREIWTGEPIMPDEQSLVASLFTLIENTMFRGDRLQSSGFVTMMSPGQFVSLNLKEGNRNDEYIQYDVTNDCLDTSFIRNPLQSTIGGKYE